MLIVDRFKRARKAQKLSQVALAGAVGMSEGAIRKIEAGNTPMPRNIVQLAQALDVTAGWLFGEGPDDLPISTRRDQLVPIDLFSVKLMGRVEAGVWREAEEPLEDDQKTYMFRRRANFEGFEHMALEIIGDSMN